MKRLLPLLPAILLWSLATTAQAAGNPLPPDQAYPISAHASGPTSVAVHWNIKPDYYLYANSFKFASQTPGIKVGKVKLPPGQLENDKFLGRTLIYTHGVTAQLAIHRRAGATRDLTLEVTARGCEKNIVCYPPFTRTLHISLAQQAAASAASTANPLAALTGETHASGFLPPNQAFRLSLQVASAERLVAHWFIAKGYHLYRNRMKFSLRHAPGLKLGKIRLPKGRVINGPYLGRQAIYEHPVSVTVPIRRNGIGPGSGTLVVSYQGCADKGICYPPITRHLAFELPPKGQAPAASAGSAPMATTAHGDPGGGSTQAGGTEQGRLAQFLLHKPLWMSLGLFFIIGLGLAFTPCVFPLLPILSGIIVGQKKTPSATRTFTLSLVYVLAMSLTYTAAGVIVGLTGAGIQGWFQNPWVLSAFAAIFVLLSLSMFGFYELQMPHPVQSRLTELSNRQQGGNLAGVAVMGFLSALIVGPCVTAPLVAALLVIANTGNAVLGGLGLFSLSLGMGAPLLIICTACGRFLPRAGAWMEPIKHVFGVLMLAVAIWMLSRFLPAWATAGLSALLLIASGIYMSALEPVAIASPGWHKLRKSAGFVLLLWGSLVLIGISAGDSSMLTPLKAVFSRTGGGPKTPATHALSFRPVQSVQALDAALASARGRPVMLDFYANWCVSCKELAANTFSNPKVRNALSRFVLLRADVTADNGAEQALLKRFGLYGPPGVIFFASNGREQRGLQVVGYQPPGKFLRDLAQVH